MLGAAGILWFVALLVALASELGETLRPPKPRYPPLGEYQMKKSIGVAGLQPGEFDVLAFRRLSPMRLYEAAMISSGGTTNRLERSVLVERRPAPDGPARQARDRRDDRPACR